MSVREFKDPIAVLLGEWSIGIDTYSILFRTVLAFAFAAIIGCERAHNRHSAGLRTFILVCIGAEFAMLADVYAKAVFEKTSFLLSAAALIGIAIISGNSFWYSSKNQIRGLTTAVALWAMGMIGLLIGAGFYTAALVGQAAFVICLSYLPAAERYLKNRSNHFEVHLELKNRHDLQPFITTLRRLGLRIDDIEFNPAYVDSGLSVFSISITIAKEELRKYKSHSEIIKALGTLEYVSYIEEMR